MPPYARLMACFLLIGVANSFLNLLISAYISERGETRASTEKGSIRALLTNRGLLLVSLACLLYMGQQSAVNLWIASYVQTEMGSEQAAGIALTLYWTGIMLRRFLQSAISGRINAGKWLCVCCTVSAVLFRLAFWVGSPVLLSAVLFFCVRKPR